MESSGTSGELLVSLAGEEHLLRPGTRFTFGREGDLVIDQNPYLHRRLGVVEHRDGCWWLANVGSAMTIDLTDTESLSFVRLAPGAESALTYRTCLVRFHAGRSNYELVLTSGADRPAPELKPALGPDATRSLADLTLNEEQLLLVVALAEPRLRDPAAPPDQVPLNKEVAARLGWPTTKFNRKLDYLCKKFAENGVPGLMGDSSALAKNRRSVLVTAALSAGLVGTADLSLIE